MRDSSPNARQASFAFPRRGGRRRGAGRKPKGARPGVPHRTRPQLARRFPVHVTTRVVAGLPSLRGSLAYTVLRACFAKGCDRFGFRLAHYSVQSNHLHLVAEAQDRRCLWRGLQGLFVRVAKNLNKLWERRGRVLADRYHHRILRTPREVRNALCYVLHNARRHGLSIAGIDGRSSGRWFDGWRDAVGGRTREDPGPVVGPRTWLLAKGWRRHRLLSIVERPAPRPP